MAEVVVIRRWRHLVIYLAIAFVIVFVRLLPVDAGPGGLPGPDLLLCLTFAWALRRPDYVPVTVVALVFVMTDVLFMRPLGLWTAFVILGLEFLRQREGTSRDLSFLLEWLMVAMVLTVMTVGHVATLTVFAVDRPAFGLTLLQMLATILAYPLAVLFSAKCLGIKKMAPGAVDDLGRKI